MGYLQAQLQLDLSEIFDEISDRLGGYNKMVAAAAFERVMIQPLITKMYASSITSFHEQLSRRVLQFDKEGKLFTEGIYIDIAGGCSYVALLKKQMPSRMPQFDKNTGKIQLADGTFFNPKKIGTHFHFG